MYIGLRRGISSGERQLTLWRTKMDIGYYYQILDTGILYEKGRKSGKLWRIGERKRLNEEVLFWNNLLDFILIEENGLECSEKLFDSLENLCKKYKFPNYERVLEKKRELVNSNCIFERKQEEELKIYSLMKCLMKNMQINLDIYKDKEKVYRILTILHNLPKAMHGQNILNENCNLVSYEDALLYAQWSMDKKMKQEYKKYFD